MFVGHYGISLAMKSLAIKAAATKSRSADGLVGSSVPLWVWFLAVQWLDLVWAILVLLGIEQLRIVPGFTEANAIDLHFMPFTHGLPGAITLSLVFGAFLATFYGGSKLKIAALGFAAAFSHWLLDLIVHVPDLPLYGNTAKVGFGLWRHVAISFPVELAFLGAGAWLYARDANFAGSFGKYIFVGFIGFFVALQAYANFGPPPSSPEEMAATALVLFLALAAVAGWVERRATAQS
jgi:hypothetical protein